MKAMLILIACAALVAVGGAMGWTFGHATGYDSGHAQGIKDGKAQQIARANAQALAEMSQMLESHKSLVAAAGQASKAMRTALAQRAAHDAQTTKEFQHALASTAASRAGCVFPADVMRQLSEARDRAAQAATSGVRSALPDASTDSPKR